MELAGAGGSWRERAGERTLLKIGAAPHLLGQLQICVSTAPSLVSLFGNERRKQKKRARPPPNLEHNDMLTAPFHSAVALHAWYVALGMMHNEIAQ